jgi:16S rRNA (cytosine967-C5)-methyltransferase
LANFAAYTEKMKVHRVLVTAIAETLQRIFAEGVYADKAVEQVLKQNPSWGSRDRRFIADNVYNIVRWWRLVNELAGADRKDDYFFLSGVWLAFSTGIIPSWNEFRSIDPEGIAEKYEKIRSQRRIKESVPDWLDELAVAELGEDVWTKEITALNTPANVVLRINTLKTSLDAAEKKLAEETIEVKRVPGYDDALMLSKRQNLQNSESYKKGLIEVQDASSQLIAPFMKLEAGMSVIDACAGAGGKSLHIAAKLKNKGKILSMDLEERKLKELERRAERAGAKIISTEVIRNGTIGRLKESADRVLLDVPCSGLGVLRRSPDTKWKLKPEFLDQIRDTQQQIISEYSQMVKPGGMLIYATCSILPSENQEQVKRFLERHKEFVFEEDRKVLASEGFDGFYMARMKRT